MFFNLWVRMELQANCSSKNCPLYCEKNCLTLSTLIFQVGLAHLEGQAQVVSQEPLEVLDLRDGLVHPDHLVLLVSVDHLEALDQLDSLDHLVHLDHLDHLDSLVDLEDKGGLVILFMHFRLQKGAVFHKYNNNPLKVLILSLEKSKKAEV